MSLPLVLVLSGCTLAASLLGLTQSATGTVTGRIYNPATREYVRNAEVRLAGTALVTESESDGTFAFPSVPAGPVTLTVTYTGYDSATARVNVSPATIATNVAVYRKLPYDAVKDYTPVSLLGWTPNILVLHSSVPAGNLKELIALACGVSRLCDGCIVHHTKAAKAAGATLAEIQETLDVCVLMGGGPATVYGKKAIEAFNA